MHRCVWTPRQRCQELDQLWQMWTPNKALGMTGVRAAYAIAPEHVTEQELTALRLLAPSWVVGAHGVAMLQAWTQPGAAMAASQSGAAARLEKPAVAAVRTAGLAGAAG